MKTKLILLALALGCIAGTADAKKKKTSGNPIFPGWYADPEGAVLDGKYWIFPTYSAPYDQQIHFDEFLHTVLAPQEEFNTWLADIRKPPAQ